MEQQFQWRQQPPFPMAEWLSEHGGGCGSSTAAWNGGFFRHGGFWQQQWRPLTTETTLRPLLPVIFSLSFSVLQQRRRGGDGTTTRHDADRGSFGDGSSSEWQRRRRELPLPSSPPCLSLSRVSLSILHFVSLSFSSQRRHDGSPSFLSVPSSFPSPSLPSLLPSASLIPLFSLSVLH
ncbi:hypothetical protein PIB30_078535 [Stylosanthes scabra]|uniref:Uncharacterized protein n=1 Tax=Stylosanthes scabra TaxID=79078 RepID=A0ABU6ZPK0_9FABA|nr:hypothetical protein [Stylosanthes scabra]